VSPVLLPEFASLIEAPSCGYMKTQNSNRTNQNARTLLKSVSVKAKEKTKFVRKKTKYLLFFTC